MVLHGRRWGPEKEFTEKEKTLRRWSPKRKGEEDDDCCIRHQRRHEKLKAFEEEEKT